MIDELDLLKKNWKNIDKTFNQVSENQLYAMIHKKSSNIVKWILIISLLELALLIFSSIYFKIDKSVDTKLSEVETIYLTITEIISYLILIFFIIKFYLNYKKVKFENNSKDLLNSILKIRKTVETYVKIIIVYYIITSYVFIGMIMVKNEEVFKIIDQFQDKGGMFLFYLFLILIILVTTFIVYFFIWGFYKILYGILLKKLMKNYDDIKQMEV